MTLTTEEAQALYQLIEILSGGNAHCAFAWDGSDSMDDPMTSATVKLYLAAGEDVPESCGGEE